LGFGLWLLLWSLTSSACLGKAVVCTGIEHELERESAQFGGGGGFVRCDDFHWCKQITQMRDDLRIEKIKPMKKGPDDRSISQRNRHHVTFRPTMTNSQNLLKDLKVPDT